eukprot:m.39221 g.39221  ORF g.39221 m.39221 type:complete len:55 (+) comp12649_c0_seq2:132-296(+)
MSNLDEFVPELVEGEHPFTDLDLVRLQLRRIYQTIFPPLFILAGHSKRLKVCSR